MPLTRAVAMPRPDTNLPTLSCPCSTSQVPRANTLTRVSRADAVRAAFCNPDTNPTRRPQRINSRLRRPNSARLAPRRPNRSNNSRLRSLSAAKASRLLAMATRASSRRAIAGVKATWLNSSRGVNTTATRARRQSV